MNMEDIDGKGGERRKKRPLTGEEYHRLAHNPDELKSTYQSFCSNCNVKKMFRNGER